MVGVGVAVHKQSSDAVAAARAQWKRRLFDKYEDEEIVARIVNGEVWQGQSEEQVIESLSAPVQVDEKVLKTKTKRILKYQQDGVNRFKLRVTIENDEVVGWDKRD